LCVKQSAGVHYSCWDFRAPVAVCLV